MFRRQELEKNCASLLSAVVGKKDVVFFSSCRNALAALLRSFSFKRTDEVILQSFICDSLVAAIEAAGAKPVLVDVDQQVLNLSAAAVEKKISQHTKAVIFVHTYGNTAGIQEMQELCRRRKIILIEDIAHALGSSYQGKPAGSFGDYVVYSFTKQMVNTGGGALLTDKDTTFIKNIKGQEPGRASWLVAVQRLVGSLYETRAFWLSKLLIDIARRRKQIKMSNALDSHYSISRLELLLAAWQIPIIFRQQKRRQLNYSRIRSSVSTQQLAAGATPHYLSFFFPSKNRRDNAKHFLWLPVWKGSSVSGKMLFVPNRPGFSRRTLGSLVAAWGRAVVR